MDLSNLKPAKGSTRKGVRLGRGEGSTRGGTAGRGHKGQKSRSGYSKKVGFEGGQQPLQRRVPKFGFKNINRVEYKGINLDTIQALADKKKVKKVDRELLIENGLVSKNDLIKILGRGELTTKLDITAHAFSKSALAALEKHGGKASVIETNETKRAEERKTKKMKAKVAPKKAVKAKTEESKEKETKVEEAKVEETAEESTDVSDETLPAGQAGSAKSEASAKEDVSSEASAKEEEKPTEESNGSTEEETVVKEVEETKE